LYLCWDMKNENLREAQKQNCTNEEAQGNDVLAEVGRSSFYVNPREWNLFQWCYAYVLWHLTWGGLINLIVWAFS